MDQISKALNLLSRSAIKLREFEGQELSSDDEIFVRGILQELAENTEEILMTNCMIFKDAAKKLDITPSSLRHAVCNESLPQRYFFMYHGYQYMTEEGVRFYRKNLKRAKKGSGRQKKTKRIGPID